MAGSRKPYTPPRLTVFGDIRTITGTAGTRSKDGGNNAVTSRT